jgi:hypothetical protein
VKNHLSLRKKEKPTKNSYVKKYKTSRKKEKLTIDTYEPRNELVEHLEKRKRFEEEYKKTEDAEIEISAEQKQELDNLEKMKVDILNKYVFPSMANVVVFLEYCKNPLLQDVFNKDIEELLLGIHKDHYEKKLKDYTNYEDETVIARFLTASLAQNSKWKLLLFPIIQRAITSNIHAILYDLLGPSIFNLIVVNDFGRADALAVLVGKYTKIKTDMPHRPVKFQLRNE